MITNIKFRRIHFPCKNSNDAVINNHKGSASSRATDNRISLSLKSKNPKFSEKNADLRSRCGRDGKIRKDKAPINSVLSFLYSTRSRGRTGTTLLSLVFETNASTNSAIRAAKSVICSAKVMIYRGTPNFFRIFLRPYCLPKWTRSLAALAGPTRAESSSAGAVRIFSTVRKWRNRSSMVFGPTPSIFSSSL